MELFQRHILLKRWLPAVLVAGSVCGIVQWRLSVAHRIAHPESKPATLPTTAPIQADPLANATPVTQPTTTTAAATPKPSPAAPADVLSVVRLDQPSYPTTAPLDLPADLPDAAKIVLNRPAYVDPQGNLWLTHPQGQPLAEALSVPVVDRTIVVRETVKYVDWPPDGGPASAVIDDGTVVRSAKTSVRTDPTQPAATQPSLRNADFARAVAVPGMTLVPTRDPDQSCVLMLGDDLSIKNTALLPADDHADKPIASPALAAAGDGAWAWVPWENRRPGSRAVFIDASGPHEPDAAAGWPDMPIDVIPLADGSVLVVAVDGDIDDFKIGRARTLLKLIPAPDKPPTAELLRVVGALARKLADPEPTHREAAQRALEAQGPAAYPVLETLREQLPPEAQVRIETLLGQRFSPTLAGLRPLDGECRTLARFPGGGCVLRFDGGGDVSDPDDATAPPRTVIPATVLIRPGHAIELINPEAACDFVPGRQSIQSIGPDVFIADPTDGSRRWLGETLLLPITSKAYADFDTVVAIDARRRWLLTSARQPGRTLLIDPTLPDTTPKLPVWTIAAPGGAGRSAEGWPTVRRDDRVLMLTKTGWQETPGDAKAKTTAEQNIDAETDAKAEVLADARSTTSPATGPTTAQALPPAAARGEVSISVGSHVFVYTPDGRVRRFTTNVATAMPATASSSTSPATVSTPTLEATFTQGIPAAADKVWLDPAGRLVMTTGSTLSVAFPDGRVPRAMADLMMRVER